MKTKSKRQLEKILRQIPGYDPWSQKASSWLDHDAALRAINWFHDNLKHVEGSARGLPFTLRCWQAAIVGNLFGWKRKDDDGRTVRRYRKSLIKVARGNGKSPLASGIVLHGFFEDDEPGAQCYLAAGQREQAGILFRNARGMVEQNKRLLSAVTVYAGDQHRSLVLKKDPLSFCKTIPADAAGQHGGIPHITVVDELHVQESRDLLDVFETAMAKKVRAQPLLVMITTSDFDRASICNEVDDYAHRVRDNKGDPAKPGFDPSFLPVIYELSPEDDWRSEELFIKANPNLDVSVSRESLIKIVQQVGERPALENEVKRLHFNIRTSQKTSLIHMEQWDACNERLDPESLKGRDCYGGMDLASREDLASLALLFPLEDERIAVLSFSWCPAVKVAHRARQRVPYDVWERQGHLLVTDGDQIDYSEIRSKIDELYQLYSIHQIAYDPRDATQLAGELDAAYGPEFMINMRQSMEHLSAPTKELLRRIKLKKIIHGGNPLLRWQASNLAGYYKGKIPQGAKLEDFLDTVPVMPSKQSSADKIDAIAAMVMALGMTMTATPPKESVYETRGMVSL